LADHHKEVRGFDLNFSNLLSLKKVLRGDLNWRRNNEDAGIPVRSEDAIVRSD
jgi:hypothetical protein